MSKRACMILMVCAGALTIAPQPASAQTAVAWGQPPSPQPWTWSYDPRYAAPGEIDPEETAGSSWYGWQILASVGAFTASTVTTVAMAPDTAAISVPIGITGVTFSGPIIHWSHGHVGRGFASLGLNLGLTAGGGALGFELLCSGGGCSGDFGALAAIFGASLGGGLGTLAAVAIDAGALAYDDREEAPSDAKRQEPRRLLLPTVEVLPDRAALGVLGTF